MLYVYTLHTLTGSAVCSHWRESEGASSGLCSNTTDFETSTGMSGSGADNQTSGSGMGNKTSGSGQDYNILGSGMGNPTSVSNMANESIVAGTNGVKSIQVDTRSGRKI